MKTAETWAKGESSIKGILGNLTVDIAKQIQIDALEHAADICLSHNNSGEGKHCKDAIMEFRETLLE